MKTMVDRGEINEAENELLDRIDYADKELWQKLCFSTNMLHPKGMNFLEAHNYSPGGNKGWDPAAGRRRRIWKYYKYA